MKILWGLEPFNQSNKAIKGMNKLLLQFAERSTQINIGYIVTGHEVKLYTAFDIPSEQRFTLHPKKILQNKLREAKVEINPKNIHIIQHRTLSTTKSVDKFLSFAKSMKVEMLALHTQGKKGVNRLIIGSFAETVIHRSKINLLVVNPKIKFKPRIKNVLFSSDFSVSSKKDLLKALQLCKQLRAKLTVFHAAEAIYKVSLTESSPEVHKYRKETQRMIEWIEKTCKKSDVICTVVVKSEFNSVTDLALSTAQKMDADLIVISAKTGPLSALMGGSVTRKIVRNGKYPVLVLKC